MIDIPPEIRGLIFDLDGTIADTMPLHYRAWVQALAELGHPFPEPLFYAMAGIPTLQIVHLLNQKHGYALPADAVAQRRDTLFEQMIPGVAPVEPVVQMIHRYAGQLPMAVATGGSSLICAKTLTALGLTDHFAVVVTADDVRHGKPAPDVFLKAAERLGLKPEQCLVFEDGDPGIVAAQQANMQVVDVRPHYVEKRA